MKKIIDRFNQPNTLLIISLYPKKGETYSAGTSGVASYTKNIATNLNQPVIILADTYSNCPQKPYQEKNTLVFRCFTKNSPLMWLQILNQIKTLKNINTINLQFVSSMYGGPFTTAFVAPFISFLKLSGYITSITLHHVVDDIFKLRGHVGLSQSTIDTLKGNTYNLIFHTFYRFLELSTDAIFVLEQTLKNNLLSIIPSANIITVPHGVDTKLKKIPQKTARQKLHLPPNQKIVLFFGYLNWFKGADIFAKTFTNTETVLGKNTKFIIAGGISPTLKNKPYYQKFYNSIQKIVDKDKNLSLTGYIDQKDIPTYFSAADLIVFPYRHHTAASGVMSLVFSYQKPFIISQKISTFFNSPDFKQAFSQAKLKKSDLVFRLTRSQCLSLTKKMLKNGSLAKTSLLSKSMRQIRNYQKTAPIITQSLFHPSILRQKVLPLRYEISSQ